MSETFGLIKGTKCLLRKADPEIVVTLSEKREIDPSLVKEMMGYNLFTVNQFANLSGLSVSAIHNKMRPILIGDTWSTELDFCYPFRDKDGDGVDRTRRGPRARSERRSGRRRTARPAPAPGGDRRHGSGERGAVYPLDVTRCSTFLISDDVRFILR